MKKNKQVVLVKDSLQPYGGLEKYAREIGNAFAKRGLEPLFLTSRVPARDYWPSFAAIETLDIKKNASYARLKEFDLKCQNWRKKNQPDIFFGLDRLSWQTHLRAGNGVHKAFLEKKYPKDHYFSSSIKKWINPLHRTILHMEKKAFENPDLKLLFTNSKMVKKEILNYYRVSPEKIKVIHNGVQWQDLHHEFSNWVEAKKKITLSYNLDPSSYQFLFIGHGYERKGLEPFLKGASLLSGKDFHISIIGKEKNKEAFLQLAEKLRLKQQTTFFDQQKDPIPFYKMADCLVIPSIYDPFANVTVEGLAMGLFVVSSKFNGGHEVLTPANGSIIEDLFDPFSVKYALETAMEQPKTWLSSKEIRESVKHLDFSIQLNQLVDLCLQE
ncbi:MAG: glycosyltransferase family 4 protein [Simkaniaceae bacterium]